MESRRGSCGDGREQCLFALQAMQVTDATDLKHCRSLAASRLRGVAESDCLGTQR